MDGKQVSLELHASFLLYVYCAIGRFVMYGKQVSYKYCYIPICASPDPYVRA
jgi:hypothetical protein